MQRMRYLMAFVLVSVLWHGAIAGTCDGYTGLDLLACEKSHHKIKGGSSSTGRRVADAVLDTSSKKPRQASTKAGKGSRHATKHHHVPNNRRFSSGSNTIVETAKAAKSHTKKTSVSSSATDITRVREMPDTGLSTGYMGDMLVSDSSDSSTSFSESVPMLASEEGLSLPSTGVGDDALYRIY